MFSMFDSLDVGNLLSRQLIYRTVPYDRSDNFIEDLLAYYTDSDLEGLIRPHVGKSWKLRLWPFKVINASFFASFSMRSSNLLARIVTCAFVRDTL